MTRPRNRNVCPDAHGVACSRYEPRIAAQPRACPADADDGRPFLFSCELILGRSKQYLRATLRGVFVEDEHADRLIGVASITTCRGGTLLRTCSSCWKSHPHHASLHAAVQVHRLSHHGHIRAAGREERCMQLRRDLLRVVGAV
jgi:hypothetical protein